MKKITFILGIVLAALLLAGCGGGGGGQTQWDVTMNDFVFEPSTVTVPTGAQVTINLNNQGTQDHNFVIMQLGKDVSGSWSDANKGDVFYEKDQLLSGQTTAITFTAPNEPGEYQILCSVPGHLEAGMMGKLVVTGK